MIQPAACALRHFVEMVVGHVAADAEELVDLMALVFVVGGEEVWFTALVHCVFSGRKKAPPVAEDRWGCGDEVRASDRS